MCAGDKLQIERYANYSICYDLHKAFELCMLFWVWRYGEIILWRTKGKIIDRNLKIWIPIFFLLIVEVVFLPSQPLERFCLRNQNLFQFVWTANRRKISTNIWFRIQAAYLFIDFSCLQNFPMYTKTYLKYAHRVRGRNIVWNEKKVLNLFISPLFHAKKIKIEWSDK